MPSATMVDRLRADGHTFDPVWGWRTPGGDPLDVRASAYDTCVTLGQDPMYAGDTLLPARVVQYYESLGDEVLEYAALGWMRGRGFSMKDPWRKFVPPDRGRKKPRSKKDEGTVVEASTGEPVMDLSDLESRSGTSTSRPEPVFAGYSVAVDVEKVLLTPSTVEGLSKELRKELRDTLRPEHWQPQRKAGKITCRYVGEVLRTLRLMGRDGLTTDYTVVSKRLVQELRWHRPRLDGRRVFTADEL